MIYPVRPLYWNASDTCFPMNKYMAQRFPKVWFRTLWFPALISNTMQHSFPLWLPTLRLKTVVTNCLVPIKRKRLKPNYPNTWHPTPLLAVPQSVSAPSTLSAGYHKQLPLHFMSHANISETAAVRSVPWAVGDWRDVTEAFQSSRIQKTSSWRINEKTAHTFTLQNWTIVAAQQTPTVLLLQDGCTFYARHHAGSLASCFVQFTHLSPCSKKAEVKQRPLHSETSMKCCR